MFWKIALGLGFFGLILSIIIIIIAGPAFFNTTDPTTENIAFIGLLIGVLLLIGSFLLAIVSLIFVLRGSKKKWDAENPK